MLNNDKKIVRELAKRYMEIATSEKQMKANARMKATNDLKIVRPPLLLDEIQWGQVNVDGSLNCYCEDPRARRVESILRQRIYRSEHYKADAIFDTFWRVRMKLTKGSDGFPTEKVEKIQGDKSSISALSFEDLLEDESSIDNLTIPDFQLHPDVDDENMNFHIDLLGDSMPVVLCGHNFFHFQPWDKLARLRNIEPILIDMYDRPEYLHKLISHSVKVFEAELDFIEKNMPVDSTVTDLHCTPAMISGLEGDGLKATWFRGNAQPFSTVSPIQFKEFEIDYIKPVAERFAYSYYGCCEPLDDRMNYVKEIKNLRKIGVSPWASVEKCAEQIGKNYVLARKPNPANVAFSTDYDVIYKEIEDTVLAAIKYGCPCEFVLKDISTISNKPENLIIWCNAASDVLDKYYGQE